MTRRSSFSGRETEREITESHELLRICLRGGTAGLLFAGYSGLSPAGVVSWRLTGRPNTSSVPDQPDQDRVTFCAGTSSLPRGLPLPGEV